jgi:putative addiction module component (TIGR02574 family)
MSGGILTMYISNVELFKHVLDLSEKDRAALAGLLISSLEEEPDSGLESIWRLEVARRVAELDVGKADTIPWEDAKKRLMKNSNAK